MTAKRTHLLRHRMVFALDQVNTFCEANETKEELEYRALARKFPLMLRTHGLGPSLAFLRAKDKNHHRAILGACKAYLETQQENPLIRELKFKDEDKNKWIEDLISREWTNHSYQHLSRELGLFLDCVKLHAEGIISSPKTTSTQEPHG